MTLLARNSSFICLVGVACLFVSTEARAQSPDDAKKRAFAERLARRTRDERIDRADMHGESAAAAHHFARVASVTTNVYGIPPASPVAPTGYGYGRDAFVEALYSQILGRPAIESEVAYWDRLLVIGVTPQAVADRLWSSPEHRAQRQNGTAPGIPLQTAYRRAYAYGRSQQLGPGY